MEIEIGKEDRIRTGVAPIKDNKAKEDLSGKTELNKGLQTKGVSMPSNITLLMPHDATTIHW